MPSKFARRHYEALADTLAQAADNRRDMFERSNLADIVDRVADMLAQDNYQFKRDRFMRRVWRDGVD